MRAIRLRSLAAGAAVLLALGGGATASMAQSDAPNTRPLAINQTEGFADGQVQVFTYFQNFHCTVEAFDDTDGLGSNGNGRVAAEDPLEIQVPRCIAGRTDNGSLPTIDPAGIPIEEAQEAIILVPFFDADSDLVNDAFDLTPGVEVQCPEPGPPNTELDGLPFTCTMHPSAAFIEPVALRLAEDLTGAPVEGLPVPVPAALSPLINHSHVVEDTENDAVWWHVVLYLVKDRSVWPDFDGNCPAGRDECLTSGERVRDAQADPQVVDEEIKTNIFLFFDNQPLDHSGHN